MSTHATDAPRSEGPLQDLEHWEEFLQQRYPEEEYRAEFQTQKSKSEFRDYRKEARPSVKVQAYDGEPNPRQIEKLNRLIESGPFEVHVARTFPLDKAAEAHRELDKHYLGKLALRPQ